MFYVMIIKYIKLTDENKAILGKEMGKYCLVS